MRRWRDRRTEPIEVLPVADADQVAVLHDGRAEMGLVRLPVDREGLHLIPLYAEQPVVVVSRDHVVSAFDRIHVDELGDEHAWSLEELSAKDAVEAVAAGTGVVVLPMSVARLHHRRDVVAVPVEGVEESQVGLAWPVGTDDPRLEEFVGIVRGRTERSSRGAAAPAERSTKPAPSRKPDPKQQPGRSKQQPPRGRQPRKGRRRP